MTDCENTRTLTVLFPTNQPEGGHPLKPANVKMSGGVPTVESRAPKIPAASLKRSPANGDSRVPDSCLLGIAQTYGLAANMETSFEDNMEWRLHEAPEDIARLRRAPTPRLEGWIIYQSVWDTMICQALGEYRYVVREPSNVWTSWADMTPAPAGMGLAEVQKSVGSLRRLLG